MLKDNVIVSKRQIKVTRTGIKLIGRAFLRHVQGPSTGNKVAFQQSDKKRRKKDIYHSIHEEVEKTLYIVGCTQQYSLCKDVNTVHTLP